MQGMLNSTTPLPWEKKGLVFQPNMPGFTHASHPCAIHYKDNVFIVAFTCRDLNKRSHVFLSYATVEQGSVVLVGTPKLALAPGDAGTFDCDGVISVCLIRHGDQHYLYYVGWQNLPEGLWICDTGRATLDPASLSLVKEFSGPVLGRDKSNPLFAAATAFQITDDGIWHTWYNSGVKWEKTERGWHHRYGIHHAKSTNGVDWHCDPGMCIPFADDHEYAFGRPTVYREAGTYYMWFAHRATVDVPTYRIGFASSRDGLKWDRKDALAGIDVSSEGWDSEMICYPYVFEHRGILYMLYNGNSYGMTGFGLAVLEEDK
jgi:hypothetical protein